MNGTNLPYYCHSSILILITYKNIGNLKKGEFDGKGLLQFSEGGSYDGEFKAGKMSGLGTFVNPDGEETFGRFKNDDMEEDLSPVKNRIMSNIGFSEAIKQK